MRVQIKKLHANPFRDMGNYPIDQEKVQSLINSINQTGFWDNILARQKNGNIQIAYGHHRLIALMKCFKLTDYVDIPVKELDDATMIRIMANENDESWGTTPKIVDETVRVTKKFLENHPNELKKVAPTGATLGKAGHIIISKFLKGSWNETRVHYSLERLGAIETEETDEKHVDKEAIELMPTERAARDFVKAVKQIRHITPKQQRVAAKRIVKTQSYGESRVKAELLEEKLGLQKKKKEEEKTFEIFLEETTKRISRVVNDLQEIHKFKDELNSEFYSKAIEKWSFLSSLDLLATWINLFLDGGKNETKEKQTLPEHSK